MGIFANVTLVAGPVASEAAEFGGQIERPFWTEGEIEIALLRGPQASRVPPAVAAVRS